MKMLTNQEIFDKVAEHLVKQGRQSLLGVDGCGYRNNDGLMCAAGCLISSRAYNSAIEGLVVPGYLSVPNASPDSPMDRRLAKILERSGISRSAFRLVRELQILHDEDFEYGLDCWAIGMRKLADEWKLEVPEVLSEASIDQRMDELALETE